MRMCVDAHARVQVWVVKHVRIRVTPDGRACDHVRVLELVRASVSVRMRMKVRKTHTRCVVWWGRHVSARVQPEVHCEFTVHCEQAKQARPCVCNLV